MRLRGKNPAHLRFALDWWLAAPQEVEKADVTDGRSAVLFGDGPHADARQMPETRACKHSAPGVLASARAADMLAGLGIAEERQEIIEVAQLEIAQHKSFRFDARS